LIGVEYRCGRHTPQGCSYVSSGMATECFVAASRTRLGRDERAQSRTFDDRRTPSRSSRARHC
jgi:hypothetical protein